MLETDLRIWMKEVLGDLLRWVEPGRGIGSGVADCVVRLPDESDIPVELKLWVYRPSGLLECKMRPAQIRYHFMSAHKKKGPTAICYLVLDADDWKVFLLNGKFVPQDKYKHQVVEKSIFVAKKSEKNKGAVRVRLINLLWGIK